MRLPKSCLPGVVFLTAAAGAGVAAETGRTVLDLNTPWRFLMVNRTDRVKRASGKLEYVRPKRRGNTVKELKPWPVRTVPAPPPKDWFAPGYDDGSWGRIRGKLELLPVGRAVIYLRGAFEVNGPCEMRLHLKFQGGAIAYLNGKEVGRAHLPKGEVDSETPAADYDEKAYLTAKGGGVPLHPYHKYGRDAPEFEERMRTLDAKIPASALRKGVNVLAVEINRAPAAEMMYTRIQYEKGGKTWWSRLGLEDIRLSASGSGVVAGNLRPAGFQVWNCDAVELVSAADWGNPCEPLRPVRITGARNGRHTGMVVASSGAAIRGAKAMPSDLSGPGKIPAAAVEILWGLPDRALMRRTRTPCFDTLDEIPPAEVPVDASGKGAVLPIWISVKVPADAKPGEYKGEVTVSSKGTQPVEVPVKLSVVDWRMPDGRDLSTFLDLVQSPDTLAMKYEVEPWSEEHWKLIGRSFELMGRLGVKTLWVPLIAKTHFGNAHSMVRWRKVPVPGARGQVPGTPGKPDTRDPAPGTWKHDFGIAERYVKTAVKHLGTVQLTCLYCWEPAKVGAHWHHGKDYGEREILFSLQNGSGKAEVLKGPDWGTPECEKFWRPVFDGMRRILKENGLEGTAMVGLCDDYEPSENSVRTLKAVAPEMKWVVHSHVSSWLLKGVRGRPVGYLACIWGIHGVHDPDDPALGNTARSYGWKHRVKLCTFPRGWPRPNSHPAMYRTYMERAVTAMGKYGSWKTEDGKPADGWSGTDGAGRMGADFWEVLKDKRGRVRGTLAGAYSYWGGLDLNRYSIPNVLGPGKKRPQATVRSELFRETIQENEIRFFLERALTDGKNRARLGDARRAGARQPGQRAGRQRGPGQMAVVRGLRREGSLGATVQGWRGGGGQTGSQVRKVL